MFHPLINILHERLLNLYFNHYDQNLLLIFNNISNDIYLENILQTIHFYLRIIILYWRIF